MKLVFILSLFWSALVMAFDPSLPTFSKILNKSQTIVMGYYLKSAPTLLEDGQKVVQALIKVERSQGLDFVTQGFEELLIHFPLNQQKIDFIPGEKLIVFLRHSNDRYWVYQGKLGAFRVITYGKRSYLVNAEFPQDKDLSQISLHAFERLLIDRLGHTLKTSRHKDWTLNESKESIERGRSIASFSEHPEGVKPLPEQRVSAMWLGVVLALVGACYQFFWLFFSRSKS